MSRLVRYPGARAQADGDGGSSADSYIGKLAKYVPAELLSAASIVFAAFTPSGLTLFIALVVAAFINIAYLWTLGQFAKGEPPPRWYFYVLSALAFGCWAVVVLEPASNAFGIAGEDNAAKRAAVLAGAAFVIPFVDTMITALYAKRRRKSTHTADTTASHDTATDTDTATEKI